MELGTAVTWSQSEFSMLGEAAFRDRCSGCAEWSGSMRRARKCNPALEGLSNHWKPTGLTGNRIQERGGDGPVSQG